MKQAGRMLGKAHMACKPPVLAACAGLGMALFCDGTAPQIREGKSLLGSFSEGKAHC